MLLPGAPHHSTVGILLSFNKERPYSHSAIAVLLDSQSIQVIAFTIEAIPPDRPQHLCHLGCPPAKRARRAAHSARPRARSMHIKSWTLTDPCQGPSRQVQKSKATGQTSILTWEYQRSPIETSTRVLSCQPVPFRPPFPGQLFSPEDQASTL